MATWQFNICRRRPRSARYYQIFGREPDYPCYVLFAQFLYSILKCVFFYGLLFLIIKWYVWPTIVPNIMKYEPVQKTLNHSLSLIDRLNLSRKLPFT